MSNITELPLLAPVPKVVTEAFLARLLVFLLMTCSGFLEMNLTGSPRILSERIFRKLNAINSHVIIRWDDKSSFIFLIYDFIQLKLKKGSFQRQ